MIFKNLYSERAMFDFGGKRYQCREGLFDAGKDKELEDFLKKNPCFVLAKGKPESNKPVPEPDGLDDLNDEELRALIVKKGLLPESTLARIKSRETLLAKIREASD